jgi:hypothetical protein
MKKIIFLFLLNLYMAQEIIPLILELDKKYLKNVKKDYEEAHKFWLESLNTKVIGKKSDYSILGMEDLYFIDLWDWYTIVRKDDKKITIFLEKFIDLCLEQIIKNKYIKENNPIPYGISNGINSSFDFFNKYIYSKHYEPHYKKYNKNFSLDDLIVLIKIINLSHWEVQQYEKLFLIMANFIDYYYHVTENNSVDFYEHLLTPFEPMEKEFNFYILIMQQYKLSDKYTDLIVDKKNKLEKLKIIYKNI